jgi:hypothetical protein
MKYPVGLGRGCGEMRVFKVIFVNQGKVYEVYAKAVRQGDLYGFVEVEGLVFGDAAKVLVDPAEERLKGEFQGVSRSLIPIHAVIRIDEMEKEGQSKIHEIAEKGNVTPFPGMVYAPERRPDK